MPNREDSSDADYGRQWNERKHWEVDTTCLNVDWVMGISTDLHKIGKTEFPDCKYRLGHPYWRAQKLCLRQHPYLRPLVYKVGPFDLETLLESQKIYIEWQIWFCTLVKKTRFTEI